MTREEKNEELEWIEDQIACELWLQRQQYIRREGCDPELGKFLDILRRLDLWDI